MGFPCHKCHSCCCCSCLYFFDCCFFLSFAQATLVVHYLLTRVTAQYRLENTPIYVPMVQMQCRHRLHFKFTVRIQCSVCFWFCMLLLFSCFIWLILPLKVGVVSWGVEDICKGQTVVLSHEHTRDYHINLFKVQPFLKEHLGNRTAKYAPLTFLE